MGAIEDLKDTMNRESLLYPFDRLQTTAILDIAARLTALERTVKDYKEAVDAITAWADRKDRQAYEQAMEEIPDAPAPDKEEIIRKYTDFFMNTPVSLWRDEIEDILSDLIDEVTK